MSMSARFLVRRPAAVCRSKDRPVVTTPPPFASDGTGTDAHGCARRWNLEVRGSRRCDFGRISYALLPILFLVHYTITGGGTPDILLIIPSSLQEKMSQELGPNPPTPWSELSTLANVM